MSKKSLFVLLSALILSGVCFAQEEPAKKQTEETAPAVEQQQPAKEQVQETAPAAAQQQPALVLEEIQISSAIEGRQPSGVGTVFPDDLDKLYCFTKIGGAENTAYVYHVWYLGNDEVARVKLPVKSKSWRTWSSKKLGMGLGNGRVEIVSESGDVLGQAEFEIQAAEKAEGVGTTGKTEEVEKTGKTGVFEKAPEAPKGQ